ncbi:hypothetical protein HJFPF1_04107 [Paramyrothecium foliicola]|nr:hypothetical protein HJFPF1_04107 [Paramyrothecium foliicola]
MKASLLFSIILGLGEAMAVTAQVETDKRAFISFEQWVEDMIANPEENHLTPEEAFDANLVLRNNTDSRNYKRFSNLAGRDAVACINYLASISSRPCVVHNPVQTFRRIGGAWMFGSKPGTVTADRTDSCGNVVRTGGKIMDSCWRVDDTVMGFETTINGQYGVGIARNT